MCWIYCAPERMAMTSFMAETSVRMDSWRSLKYFKRKSQVKRCCALAWPFSWSFCGNFFYHFCTKSIAAKTTLAAGFGIRAGFGASCWVWGETQFPGERGPASHKTAPGPWKANFLLGGILHLERRE